MADKAFTFGGAATAGDGTPEGPAVPDKPSIAVLAFRNMSGDATQDYFADGIVEGIITALSRMSWLLVIARNSSFVYKGRNVDIRQVGAELGVRYVLEGSVLKAANRVRITGDLIDTSNNAPVWADAFDGSLDDIFDLQEQVTMGVAGAMAPRLEQAEIRHARYEPTGSLQSYDCYLRALTAFRRDDLEAHREARRMVDEAIALDPEFAAPYGLAAWLHNQRLRNGWVENHAQERAEARRLALRAAELGPEDAVALCNAGSTLGLTAHELDAGIALIDRARELNPNLAMAWWASAWLRAWGGEPETAIRHAARARRLSPLDPLAHHTDAATSLAYLCLRRYDDAIAWGEKSLSRQATFQSALRILASGYALAGRIDEARSTMAQVRALSPLLRIADVRIIAPWRHEEHRERYLEGLRLAGLPE
jgi:TolB-like protein